MTFIKTKERNTLNIGFKLTGGQHSTSQFLLAYTQTYQESTSETESEDTSITQRSSNHLNIYLPLIKYQFMRVFQSTIDRALRQHMSRRLRHRVSRHKAELMRRTVCNIIEPLGMVQLQRRAGRVGATDQNISSYSSGEAVTYHVLCQPCDVQICHQVY